MRSQAKRVFAVTAVGWLSAFAAQKDGAGMQGGNGGSGAGALPGYGSSAPGSYPGKSTPSNSAAEHVTVLGFISKTAKEIGKKYGGNAPELLPLVEQIQNDVKFLQLEWSKWGKNYGASAPNVPLEMDPYYKSLKSMSATLKQAQKKLAGAELINVVRNVAVDIRNKAINCRNSSDGLGKQIIVTARTLKAGAEMKGFEICYVPMALLGQKAEYKRFPVLSSPCTDNNVPPGYYAIWLRKDNQTNTFTAQDILGDSRGKCSLEIVVPDEFFAAR